MERPILFNAEMVRAILDGRKTQTRRPVDIVRMCGDSESHASRGAWRQLGSGLWQSSAGSWNVWSSPMPCPFGSVGDRLWVRESGYEPPRRITGQMLREGADTWPDFMYAADAGFDRDWCRRNGWRSRPSIHMRREFSRITLEVNAVRVERLRSISVSDVHAEGMPSGLAQGFSEQYWFRDLWDGVYGRKLGWRENPWVWVVEFAVVDA